MPGNGRKRESNVLELPAGWIWAQAGTCDCESVSSVTGKLPTAPRVAYAENRSSDLEREIGKGPVIPAAVKLTRNAQPADVAPRMR